MPTPPQSKQWKAGRWLYLECICHILVVLWNANNEMWDFSPVSYFRCRWWSGFAKKSRFSAAHPFCLFSLKGNALESPKLSNIQLICWKMLVLAPPSINMLMSFRLHLLFTFWSVQGSSFPLFLLGQSWSLTWLPSLYCFCMSWQTRKNSGAH